MLTYPFSQYSYFDMTLLIILGVVFLGVALMVIFGERFGKPMEPEEQVKLAKLLRILVFAALFMVLFKMLLS